MIHPLISADITIFFTEICNFCDNEEYRYRLHFKGCFNKTGCNFDDVSKIGVVGKWGYLG